MKDVDNSLLPSRDSRLGRWIVLAILLSLLFHLFLLWWFGWIKMANMAIPAEREKFVFNLRRVELVNPEPPKKVELPTGNMVQATDITPSLQPSSDGREVERALADNKPQLTVPAPSDPTTALRGEIAAATIFTPSEQSKIEADIAKLPVGPSNADGVPAFVPGDVTGPATGLKVGEGGRAGAPGPPHAGGDVPGFENIATGLQAPVPAIDPRLPEPVMLRLPSDVLFDFDSAALRPEAVPLLQQAAAIIARYPIARVQVDGHSDTIGADSYNQNLSQARAQAVENYLRQALHNSNYTVQSKGWGRTRPIVNPQGSADEQMRNRRVEITIQAMTAP